MSRQINDPAVIETERLILYVDALKAYKELADKMSEKVCFEILRQLMFNRPSQFPSQEKYNITPDAKDNVVDEASLAITSILDEGKFASLEARLRGEVKLKLKMALMARLSVNNDYDYDKVKQAWDEQQVEK